MKTLLGTGTYGLNEAARLAQVHSSTARYWFLGAPSSGRKPLFRTDDLRVVNSNRAVSFLDLIDLLVVGRFRAAGVKLQTIRKVYARLRGDLESTHPFSMRELLTDGQTIFMRTLDHVGDAHLSEVISSQHAMPEVLDPYLQKIEYSTDTRLAARWHIADGIIIDPDKSFGKPVVASEGTSTYVLAQAYWANNKDEDLVADLFDTSPQAVRQAVAFEGEYAPGHAA